MKLFHFFSERPKIKNYISETLEIGYSLMGPTLTVSGTMTALEKVVFVNSISILVKRLSDGNMFQFSWQAFRPHRFKLNRESAYDLKMPSKFLITPENPYPYNILFADQNQYSLMNPFIKMIRNFWEEFTWYASKERPQETTAQLFADFLNKDNIKDFHAKIKTLCYWTAGDYLFEIIFIAKDGRPLLEVQKKFFLSEPQAKDLRANSGMIVADICGQPEITYAMAETQLQES